VCGPVSTGRVCGPVVGSCKYSNEPSRFVKYGEYLDQLNDHHLRHGWWWWWCNR